MLSCAYIHMGRLRDGVPNNRVEDKAERTDPHGWKQWTHLGGKQERCTSTCGPPICRRQIRRNKCWNCLRRLPGTRTAVQRSSKQIRHGVHCTIIEWRRSGWYRDCHTGQWHSGAGRQYLGDHIMFGKYRVDNRMHTNDPPGMRCRSDPSPTPTKVRVLYQLTCWYSLPK